MMGWSNWQGWSDFVQMGGYGLYVWGSLGVTALVLALELGQLRTRRRRLRDSLDAGGAP